MNFKDSYNTSFGEKEEEKRKGFLNLKGWKLLHPDIGNYGRLKEGIKIGEVIQKLKPF